MEKGAPVKNPLTIIAIFAGVAEVCGTGVLPLISKDVQPIYVWFLMIFPLVLVCFFFATLNWNYGVLYAPSDFADEGNFLKILRPASPDEIANKNRKEADQAEADPPSQADDSIEEQQSTKAPPDAAPSVDRNELAHSENLVKSTALSRALSAERLVLTKLAKEFHQQFREEMKILSSENIIFDGVAHINGGIIAVEVKYAQSMDRARGRLYRDIDSLLRKISNLPPAVVQGIHVIVAVVLEQAHPSDGDSVKRLDALSKRYLFKSEIRIYYYNDLEGDYRFNYL